MLCWALAIMKAVLIAHAESIVRCSADSSRRPVCKFIRSRIRGFARPSNRLIHPLLQALQTFLIRKLPKPWIRRSSFSVLPSSCRYCLKLRPGCSTSFASHSGRICSRDRATSVKGLPHPTQALFAMTYHSDVVFCPFCPEIKAYSVGLRIPSDRQIRYAVQDEDEAKKFVRETLRRRATARKGIGVPYRFCQLMNPHQWFPVALG